jgi:hypothetical protein
MSRATARCRNTKCRRKTDGRLVDPSGGATSPASPYQLRDQLAGDPCSILQEATMSDPLVFGLFSKTAAFICANLLCIVEGTILMAEPNQRWHVFGIASVALGATGLVFNTITFFGL